VKTLGRKTTPVLLIALLALLVCNTRSVDAAANAPESSTYTITDITYTHEETGSYVLTIKGNSKQPPTFITYDLFDPMRVVLDIADGSLAEGVVLPLDLSSGVVSSVQGSIITDQKTVIAKIEVLHTENSQYTIKKLDNDIQIIFTKTDPMSQSTVSDGDQET